MAALAWSTLEDAIYDWTAAALPGVVIRWGDRSDPVPQGTHVMLRWGPRGRPVGLSVAVERDLAADGLTSVSTHRAYDVLLVDAFSLSVDGASSAAAILRTFAEAQGAGAVRAALVAVDAAGGSVLAFDAPIDLTAVIGDRWRSRAAMRVEIYTVSTTSETADYIDAVDLDGSVTVTES